MRCNNNNCVNAKKDGYFGLITCTASSYDDYVKCSQIAMREREKDMQALAESKPYFDLYARLA